MKTEIMIVLDEDYTVHKGFYDRIKHEILDGLHVLQPNVEYTAEKLCGPMLWGSLKRGESPLAGRCIADMVRKGVLPLQFVGCEHLSPKRYILNSIN
ncbi:hypothetical protein P9J64_15145 [Deltaproteobacteria bacterium IMCC39524]|nr:hypothetical protein [Deltaproteobacteria bacterium IMCC39524]